MLGAVYLNYAGVSPISFRLFWKLVSFISYYYFLGPKAALVKYEKYIPLLYAEIAQLLNCRDSEISHLKNTTEGVIIAAESLPLVQGNEVLLMENEYPANLLPWFKKEKDGIRIKIASGRNSEERYENLLKNITENTRAIAVSWVQFSDGYQVDLPRLAKICREKKIYLVVDAVQIVGTQVIDLRSLDIDILICGGHKHLMSLVGCGFIYVNQRTLPELKDFKVGIRSVESFHANGYSIRKTTSRYEDGTPNILGITALYESIRFLNLYGIQKAEKKNRDLLIYYKKALQSDHISFIDYEKQGNLIHIPVKQAGDLILFLQKQKIFVRAINNEAVRVAFSYLNHKREIHLFIKQYKNWVRQQERVGNSVRQVAAL